MASSNIITQYNNAGTILHDAIKTLRTNIMFSSVDKPVKTLVMTSVVPHEGKSTMTIYLGMAMAESGQKTLLIECDCRRPMLQNYLRLRPENNLIDLLRREATVEEAVIHTDVPRLDLLSSSVLANPVEILASERFQKVLEELQSIYDIILLDTPPLGSFIEAAILASKADGVVLVLQPGSTDITAAQAVVQQLEKAKARILGVVLNGVDVAGGDYYYSDYYYRGETNKKKKSAPSKSQSGAKKNNSRSFISNRIK